MNHQRQRTCRNDDGPHDDCAPGSDGIEAKEVSDCPSPVGRCGRLC